MKSLLHPTVLWKVSYTVVMSQVVTDNTDGVWDILKYYGGLI